MSAVKPLTPDDETEIDDVIWGVIGQRDLDPRAVGHHLYVSGMVLEDGSYDPVEADAIEWQRAEDARKAARDAEDAAYLADPAEWVRLRDARRATYKAETTP